MISDISGASWDASLLTCLSRVHKYSLHARRTIQWSRQWLPGGRASPRMWRPLWVQTGVRGWQDEAADSGWARWLSPQPWSCGVHRGWTKRCSSGTTGGCVPKCQSGPGRAAQGACWCWRWLTPATRGSDDRRSWAWTWRQQRRRRWGNKAI